MPLGAAEVDGGGGAIGQPHAVQHDGAAHARGLAELPGQAPGLGRGHAAEPLLPLGRELRDMLLQEGEGRPAPLAVHLELAEERGLTD